MYTNSASAWQPEDPFAIIYEIEIQRHRLSEVAASVGHLDILWHRPAIEGEERDSASVSTTRIPIIPLALPTSLEDTALDAPLTIDCSYPSTVRLHEPFTASYHLALPSLEPAYTARPRLISYTMESAPNNFVFAGPRKTDRCLILPDPTRPMELVAEFKMVAIGQTGFVDLPVFKVWEILETPSQDEERRQRRLANESAGNVDLPDEGPPMRELRVHRIGSRIVDLADGDDARGPPLQVYVLPR